MLYTYVNKYKYIEDAYIYIYTYTYSYKKEHLKNQALFFVIFRLKVTLYEAIIRYRHKHKNV